MLQYVKSFRRTVSTLLLLTLISFGISPSAKAFDLWTTQTSAADNEWSSVAYGNGLFVAVGKSGTGNRVMTSPDGIAWTSRTSAADNTWESVAYGGGQFVAVSSDGLGNRVMTSPDGIAWTSQTSAANISWQGIAYGGGQFVAVSSSGTGNRVMTSSDGIAWTSQTSAADNSWRSIAYGGGQFVAVSGSGTNRVMISSDGINWTSRTAADNIIWKSLVYGGGQFVAVGQSAVRNGVMTSPDGINWTGRTSTANYSWNSVAYGNGLFVAVSNDGTNRVMTSPDGINWTSRVSAAYNAWYGVTYGNDLFVAVASSGTGNRVMTAPSTTMGSSSAAPGGVCWAWNMEDKASGNFLTDGSYNGSSAVARTYTLSDFKLNSSIYPSVEVGSIADQTYAFGLQPPYSFIWDGAAPTLFQRDGYTNGFGIRNGPGNKGAYLVFDIGYSSIKDQWDTTDPNLFQSVQTISLSPTARTLCDPVAGIAPLFSSASSYDGRFTVQVTNYDEAFTYSVTSNAGQVSINSTGLVTVTGLRPDQSVTVTVTTTRTGYATVSGSITGRSQVAPMIPTNKPIVTLSGTLISCTIGSYSATPTSSAFSLFVDGKHISTNFSAVGEYLPDWIIPWAISNTITRTATLSTASWLMSDAYRGKEISCATLAYSKNAIGLTASQVIVAR